METKIKRKFRAFPLSLTTAASSATPIRFDDVAGGAIEVGTAAGSSVTLTVWASDAAGSEYGRLFKDGQAVSVVLSLSTAEPRVYPFPDGCSGVGSVKLVSETAGGTAVPVVVMLKT